MIEDWIDEIAKLAGNVASSASGKANVRSFWVFKKSEFPESITEFPAAITYVIRMGLSGGSDAGPTILHWYGVSEFHISPNTGKQNYPAVMPYYGRILAAFLQKRTLGGLVNEFNLVKMGDGDALVAGTMEYGENIKHLGIAAYWHVKESITPTLGN